MTKTPDRIIPIAEVTDPSKVRVMLDRPDYLNSVPMDRMGLAILSADNTWTGVNTFTLSATFNGTIRLAETGDISSLSSTIHAFQIGATNAPHLAIDSNEIQARNNGSAASLTLNAIGGQVNIASIGNNVIVEGPLVLGSRTTLTIASGVITPTGSFHGVDTEGAAATDDLVTITAGTDGQLLVLRTVASLRDVTLKDGTGNLILAGDCVLDTLSDTITLIYSSAGNAWIELCRSNNA